MNNVATVGGANRSFNSACCQEPLNFEEFGGTDGYPRPTIIRRLPSGRGDRTPTDQWKKREEWNLKTNKNEYFESINSGLVEGTVHFQAKFEGNEEVGNEGVAGFFFLEVGGDALDGQF